MCTVVCSHHCLHAQGKQETHYSNHLKCEYNYRSKFLVLPCSFLSIQLLTTSKFIWFWQTKHDGFVAYCCIFFIIVCCRAIPSNPYNYKSKSKTNTLNNLRFYDVKLIVRVQWHDARLLLDDVAGIGCIYTPILHPALPMFLKVNDDQMAFFFFFFYFFQSISGFIRFVSFPFVSLSVLFEFILFFCFSFNTLLSFYRRFYSSSSTIHDGSLPFPFQNMMTTCSSVWFCSLSKLFFTNKHSFSVLILFVSNGFFS